MWCFILYALSLHLLQLNGQLRIISEFNMHVFGLEEEAEVPSESPCKHREGSMEYITVRWRSNTAVKLTWPALKKKTKIMLMLTIIKIKLLHIFKLKFKFPCCDKHFKNTNTYIL